MSLNSTTQSVILADAHVHLHPCFNVWDVFDAARENFRNIAQKMSPENHFIGILFLTEMPSEQAFENLRCIANISSNSVSNAQSTSDWTIHVTQESTSLLAKHTAGSILVLLAGRQIVTQEGLEVLALITDQQFEERRPLVETLSAITRAGGLPVLPWGVGKWLGRRGRFLKQILKTHDDSGIHLGDNSGRPIFWPRPSHFQMAEQRGARVLPGTDPLPLSSEAFRPGRFGFMVEGHLNLSRPSETMKDLLFNTQTAVQPYGQLETPLRFFQNQFLIRYSKAL